MNQIQQPPLIVLVGAFADRNVSGFAELREVVARSSPSTTTPLYHEWLARVALYAATRLPCASGAAMRLARLLRSGTALSIDVVQVRVFASELRQLIADHAQSRQLETLMAVCQAQRVETYEDVIDTVDVIYGGYDDIHSLYEEYRQFLSRQFGLS